MNGQPAEAAPVAAPVAAAPAPAASKLPDIKKLLADTEQMAKDLEAAKDELGPILSFALTNLRSVTLTLAGHLKNVEASEKAKAAAAAAASQPKAEATGSAT